MKNIIQNPISVGTVLCTSGTVKNGHLVITLFALLAVFNSKKRLDSYNVFNLEKYF